MDLAKNNLLDIFYSHVEESDWLEGLDLYQAGKVNKLVDYSGLITASINSNLRLPAEVRLKIHPSGQRIQWIECTCPKYRTRGQYCEHMAAFMINIDREYPRLLGMLDTKMPIKPPTPKKRPAKASGSMAGEKAKFTKGTDAAQNILSHLDQNIHSVTLLAGGPNIRVRLEMKPGQLTQYNLDLDSAARFLRNNNTPKVLSPELQSIKVFTSPAVRGSRIFQDPESSDETIIAERCYAIRHCNDSASDAKVTSAKLQTTIAEYTQYATEEIERKKNIFEFLSIKTASKYIGEEYIFLPGRGYYPIAKENLKTGWSDLPLRKSFKGDASAILLSSGFETYHTQGPLWVEDNLVDIQVKDAFKIDTIKIKRESGGWFYLDPQYTIDSQKISMTELLKQFKNKKRSYLKSGKSWLKIPDFIKENQWELDEDETYLKVNTVGLLRLQAAMGDFDQFVGSRKLLDNVRSKLDYTLQSNAPDLDQTNLNLRSYQQDGYKWLWWLYKNGLHGLLADEMGLGKTHQAMAIMSAIQAKDPNAKFLVLAPTTVIDHWHDKTNQFCPNLRPVKYHGTNRLQLNFERLGSSYTIITSYGILLRDIKRLSETPFAA